MSTLGEELPKEVDRVVGLLLEQSKKHPDGLIVNILRSAISEACMAMASQDIARMIAAFKVLREFHS